MNVYDYYAVVYIVDGNGEVINWGIKGKCTTVVAISHDEDDTTAFFDFIALTLLVDDGTYRLKFELIISGSEPPSISETGFSDWFDARRQPLVSV